MDEDVKAKWLDALRSGEYEQAEGALHVIEGGKEKFCCLGVLCDLAVQEGVDVTVRKEPGESSWKYDRENGVLPRSVQRWAGLDAENPSVFHEGDIDGIAALNDQGSTFDVLADLIEEQL
jgi:hypothetical protein